MYKKNGDKKPIGKMELINILAEEGYTKAASRIIWQDVVKVLEKCIVEGENIQLKGFGTFVIREIPERINIHPATREPVRVPAHKTVRFLLGDRLKEELANGFIRG